MVDDLLAYAAIACYGKYSLERQSYFTRVTADNAFGRSVHACYAASPVSRREKIAGIPTGLQSKTICLHATTYKPVPPRTVQDDRRQNCTRMMSLTSTRHVGITLPK